MKKLLDNRWFLFAMPFVIWFLLLVLPLIASTDRNNFQQEDRIRFITNIMTANILLLANILRLPVPWVPGNCGSIMSAAEMAYSLHREKTTSRI